MSRVGKLPIAIPEGIQVEKKDDFIIVKGEKGILKQRIHPDMKVIIEEKSVSQHGGFAGKNHMA